MANSILYLLFRMFRGINQQLQLLIVIGIWDVLCRAAIPNNRMEVKPVAVDISTY